MVKKTHKKEAKPSKVVSKSRQIVLAWRAGFAFAADHEDDLERYRELGVFPSVPLTRSTR